MKLSTLIQLVGDENVEVNWFHECSPSARETQRGTLVSFYTGSIKPGDLLFPEHGKTGFAVWIPTHLLKRIRLPSTSLNA